MAGAEKADGRDNPYKAAFWGLLERVKEAVGDPKQECFYSNPTDDHILNVLFEELGWLREEIPDENTPGKISIRYNRPKEQE